MQLTIALFTKALALQFASAPHWVDFKYEDGGNVVHLTTVNGPPSIGTVKSTKDKKDVFAVTVGVPSNGGINDVFGIPLDSDKDTEAVGRLVRAAVTAYNEQAGKVKEPQII